MWKVKSLIFFLIILLEACSSTSSTDSGSSSGGASSDDELTLSSCDTSVDENAPAFFRTYFKCVTITMEGENVVIATADLPPHRSYYYGEDSPNFTDFDTSRGSDYSPNPNTIAEQDIHVQIPLNPVAKDLTITEDLVDGVVGTSDEEYDLGTVGVALDSVALFNPLAAPGDDIADERFTFDDYNAHPTGDGTYHYHTNTAGPLEVLESLGLITSTELGEAEIEVFGIMCDGTVVLGCTELNGDVPDDSDFDAQNGHVHDLVDGDGTTLFAVRYHTHICPDLFPNHLYTPEIQFYESCNVQ